MLAEKESLIRFLCQSVIDNAMTSVVVTGNTSSGSASITGVSSISGVNAGATIQGSGIPNGATVISASGSTIVISAPATVTATAITLIISALYGSNAYWSSLATARAALLTQYNAILAKIQATNGKLVTAVTIPGQTTAWTTELSLFDQADCYQQAYNRLMGNVVLIRRTTGRYF
jgi:hypothetical protein